MIPTTAPITSELVAPPWKTIARTPTAGRARVTRRFHTLVAAIAELVAAGPNP